MNDFKFQLGQVIFIRGRRQSYVVTAQHLVRVSPGGELSPSYVILCDGIDRDRTLLVAEHSLTAEEPRHGS